MQHLSYPYSSPATKYKSPITADTPRDKIATAKHASIATFAMLLTLPAIWAASAIAVSAGDEPREQ